MKSILSATQPPGGLSRRALIAATGLGLGALLLPPAGRTQPAGGEPRVLRAGPGMAPLRGGGAPASPLWGYDGAVPGPPLRIRRGEELKVRLVNELPQPTAIHWHGVRTPAALRWPPASAPPGQEMEYRLRPPDAGTFWYHADYAAPGGLDRGLHGALIVDEPVPPPVDRDVLLVLSDWRLTPSGEIGAEGSEHLTVNGRPHLDIAVRTHERLRLRLVNATPNRMFGIGIADHPVTVMALDGQPAEPFAARDGRVVLAPGARADLFVDAVLPAGSAGTIVLATAGGQTPIVRLRYAAGPPARPAALPEPVPLPANPLPARMDFARALKLDLPLAAEATRAALAGPGRGVAAAGEGPLWLPVGETPGPPLFAVRRGRTVMLALPNRGPQPVALHIHGHAVRLLDALDDGWKPFWLDTVLVLPGQTARIAFVADSPGTWPLQALPVEAAGPGRVATFAVT